MLSLPLETKPDFPRQLEHAARFVQDSVDFVRGGAWEGMLGNIRRHQHKSALAVLGSADVDDEMRAFLSEMVADGHASREMMAKDAANPVEAGEASVQRSIGNKQTAETALEHLDSGWNGTAQPKRDISFTSPGLEASDLSLLDPNVNSSYTDKGRNSPCELSTQFLHALSPAVHWCGYF